ncbi:MAG: hypothetical protein Q9162_003886 [Coniocarpon cinnabarinum]
MALVGNMIAESRGGNPSIVNFVIFCAVFGMLSLFYLIPATFKEEFAFHPIIMITLDLLNTIFFFCGAVALAAMLDDYTITNSITNGTGLDNLEKRCREAQASDAFLFFGFAAFAASAVFSFLQSRARVFPKSESDDMG